MLYTSPLATASPPTHRDEEGAHWQGALYLLDSRRGVGGSIAWI